ncbi:MAG: aldehyde ferredoxin oxidoreductase family protein [Thermoplasmatota archaeon]
MSLSYGGYAGSLLFVDLTKGTVKVVPLKKEWCALYLGGRGRDARLLFELQEPSIAPLDPGAHVLISTGPLTGLLGPTTGRLNVAGRSPQTGLYGNSNAGTNFGPELKFAGYDGVVITGRSPRPVRLHIQDSEASLLDAGELWGEGVFETTARILEEHGPETRVAAVGPGAEAGALFGSVIFDFWDAAARTGLGTVLASKGLKAVSVRGTGSLRVADPKAYYEAAREGWMAVLEDPGFRTGEHSALGTSICVNWGNAQGWLPTRNFRESWFEGADRISGEEFRDTFSTRPAPLPAGRACFSCPNRCKRYGRIDEGKYAGTRGNIEFEGVAAFGSKCGVDDLAAVFHAYMLANDYGLDCISCGTTIAFFMECVEKGILDDGGLGLRFGSADAMVEMVHRIANREGRLGELGSLGSERAAAAIGRGSEALLSTIKGLETIACDPRAAKAFGFGFAVASRGSDHLRAHPVFEMLRMPPEVGRELFGSAEAVELRKYGGKVRLVAWHENMAVVSDSAGTCRLMHASFYAQYPVPELLSRLAKRKRPAVHSIKYHKWIEAATGIPMSYEGLMELGERVICLERALNLRWGLRPEQDTLPRRFVSERIPAGPAKGELFEPGILEEMLRDYYDLRGWDAATGRPHEGRLSALGMEDVAARLREEGLLAPGEPPRAVEPFRDPLATPAGGGAGGEGAAGAELGRRVPRGGG